MIERVKKKTLQLITVASETRERKDVWLRAVGPSSAADCRKPEKNPGKRRCQGAEEGVMNVSCHLYDCVRLWFVGELF